MRAVAAPAPPRPCALMLVCPSRLPRNLLQDASWIAAGQLVPGPWTPTPEPLMQCSPTAHYLDKRGRETVAPALEDGHEEP